MKSITKNSAAGIFKAFIIRLHLEIQYLPMPDANIQEYCFLKNKFSYYVITCSRLEYVVAFHRSRIVKYLFKLWSIHLRTHWLYTYVTKFYLSLSEIAT